MRDVSRLDEKAIVPLEKAALTYEAILGSLEADTTPILYADTSSKLAEVQFETGKRTIDIGRKEGLFQAALKTFTAASDKYRELAPLKWAQVRLRMGCLLEEMAELRSLKDIYESAIAAFKEAITIWARDTDRYRTELTDAYYHLAIAKSALGSLKREESLLDEARGVLTLARNLCEGERQEQKDNRAYIDHAVGNTYIRKSRLPREKGQRMDALRAAISHYEKAISHRELSIEKNQWASSVHYNAVAHGELAYIEHNVSRLEQSIELLRSVAPYYSLDNDVSRYVGFRSDLAATLQRFYNLMVPKNAAVLLEAIENMKKADAADLTSGPGSSSKRSAIIAEWESGVRRFEGRSFVDADFEEVPTDSHRF